VATAAQRYMNILYLLCANDFFRWSIRPTPVDVPVLFP